jgi:hypothetical protein
VLPLHLVIDQETITLAGKTKGAGFPTPFVCFEA